MNWHKLWRRLGIALSLRDPPIVPPHGWSYFDHIVSLYVTLKKPDNDASAKAAADAAKTPANDAANKVLYDAANGVIAKSRERPDDLTWGDIFLLENIVFSLAPSDMLARSAWILRERLRSIASPTIYQKYIDSGIPTQMETPEQIATMRADLCRVVDVLHWYYALIPMRERIRNSLTIQCVGWVVGYTLLLWFALHHYLHHEASFLIMLICVIYSGIIGGYVSSQRRMQAIPSDGDPFVSVLGLENAGYYLWLSPLLGAIFAVILLFMFIGGILQGTIFPAFYTGISPISPHGGVGFFDAVWNSLPTGAMDYGKLFVWAFLAGFAERLVPDSLDRLSARVLTSKGPGPVGPPSLTASAKATSGPSVLTDSANLQDQPPPPPEGGMDEVIQMEAVEEKPKGITPAVLDNVLHSGEDPEPIQAADGSK
jgi:hypothetical protein